MEIVIPRRDPDTPVYRYHNANPKGILTKDAEIRALCTAMDARYCDVVMGAAQFQIDTGYSITSHEGMARYLESRGWVYHEGPRDSDGRRYTGQDFCRLVAERDVRYVALLSIKYAATFAAIVKNKVSDTTNCTHLYVYAYWTKE